MSWGNPQTEDERLRQTVLTPLVWPYKLALDLRQLAYKQNWLSTTKLSCPVISVGNLTVGGTGKTPIIIDLASRLLAHKIKVGILSRGYARRDNSRCVVVGNGEGKFAPLEESGDEALLIAKMLPDTVVIVDQDRAAAGKKAVLDYGCQVLFLDDGFQHWRLQRDANIVLVDYADEPSKDALLPAGRLREPLSALSRATHIIITKVPQDYTQEKINYLENLAGNYSPQAKVSSCRFFSSSIEQFFSGQWQTTGINLLNNMPVVAFCGIAKAEGFFETIKKSGARVLQQISFPDHHHYSRADLDKLEQELSKTDAQYLVTTRKDLIKLDTSPLASRILAVNQNIQWIQTPPDIISLSQVPILAHQTLS